MKSAKARLKLSVTCPECKKVNGLKGLQVNKWLYTGGVKTCTCCGEKFNVAPAQTDPPDADEAEMIRAVQKIYNERFGR